MKVILSRKGFDSAAGGHPSPIIGDKLVSLPIPHYGDTTKYSDLRLDKDLIKICGKETYCDLMKSLFGEKIKYKKSKNEKADWHGLTGAFCHRDPDLDMGCFGQNNAAQTHLANKKVGDKEDGKDDLFLFFGWFQQTKKDSLQFDPKAPYLHILFGYLQVGEAILVTRESIKSSKPNCVYENIDGVIQKYPEIEEHPHLKNPEYLKKKKSGKENNNTIYVARKGLKWDEKKFGAGFFNLDEKEELVLTKKDQPCRSLWDLGMIFPIM